MTKKIKLLLGSLGATAAIVAVPVAVVACSSNDGMETETDSNLNLVSTGIWSTLNPAPNITAETTTSSTSGYKAIPTDGIPSSVDTIGELSAYVTLTAKVKDTQTTYPMPANAKVSDLKFQKGSTSEAATISFNLGVFGKVVGTAGAVGTTTSSTTYTWVVTSIGAPKTVKDLSDIIDDIPSSIDSVDVNVHIDSANLATAGQLFSGVKQYIWLTKGSGTETKLLGALIGSYTPNSDTTKAGLWSWTYDQNIEPISIVSGKTLTATGIPAATAGTTSDLTYLAQYLNMPILNEYSLAKTTAVTIATVSGTTQTITINPSTTPGMQTYTITGTYASGAWAYTLEVGTVAASSGTTNSQPKSTSDSGSTTSSTTTNKEETKPTDSSHTS